MKYISYIIINVFCSFLLGQILPWWSIVIIPFILGINVDLKPLMHCILGFISIFILWAVQALIAQQTQAADLVIKIGVLFNGLSPVLLILLTGFIGGLYGGLAELSGSLLKQLIKK